MMDRKGRIIFLASAFARFHFIRFFLWRHVKTIVCATKPSSLQDLKVKVINLISGITANQLENVFFELRNRITLCIANDGGHMET